MTASPVSAKCVEQPVRPVPTCCACILHEGRLLLIQLGQEPSKGLWSFPGGHIESSETIFEALKREVVEATGLDIEAQHVFEVYDHIIRDGAGRVRLHFVVNYMRSRYLSGEPCASSDARQVRWVNEADLLALPMHPFAHRTALRLLPEVTPGPAHAPSADTTEIEPSSEG